MRLSILAVNVALCISIHAQEQGNVIPFQGQLANQAGQPLSPISPSTLVFRLYRQAVGGIAIWEESQPNISVNAGRFSVLLGSRTELPAAPNFNATLYLGITVDDGNPATADVEMRPRQALVPVISARYAQNSDRSQNSDKLNGYDWGVLFGTNNPVDGKIAGTKLEDASITMAQLAPRPVGTIAGIGGIAVSQTVTNLAITATDFVPVSALTATLTTSGRPVVIALTGGNWVRTDGNASSTISIESSSVTVDGFLSIYRNGTLVREFLLRSDFQTATSRGLYIPSSAFSSIDFPPAAGTFTYTVRVSFYSLDGSGGVNLYNVRLIAYEL